MGGEERKSAQAGEDAASRSPAVQRDSKRAEREEKGGEGERARARKRDRKRKGREGESVLEKVDQAGDAAAV
jgi:hypothetical protein